jgi:hypothetical protein
MEPVGGDLARHDHEFEEVRWISFDEAAHLLTFDTERALVQRAREELAATNSEGAPAAGADPSADGSGQPATAQQGA